MTLDELFPGIFANPDNVGQSEYRAIHEVLSDVLDGAPEGEEKHIVISALIEFGYISRALLHRMGVKEETDEGSNSQLEADSSGEADGPATLLGRHGRPGQQDRAGQEDASQDGCTDTEPPQGEEGSTGESPGAAGERGPDPAGLKYAKLIEALRHPKNPHYTADVREEAATELEKFQNEDPPQYLISVGAVDGPLFAEQRLLVSDLSAGELVQPLTETSKQELLEGLTNFLDAIADQLHDRYGVPCLMEDEHAGDSEGGTDSNE